MPDSTIENGAPSGAVYVQTNDATSNEIVAYRRSADGALTPLGHQPTGARAPESHTCLRRAPSS